MKRVTKLTEAKVACKIVEIIEQEKEPLDLCFVRHFCEEILQENARDERDHIQEMREAMHIDSMRRP